MNRNTRIKNLGRIALFRIDLYGNRRGKDSYFAYDILAQDSDRALSLAKEIAEREGYNVRGLTTQPIKLFESNVSVEARYLQRLLKSQSRSIS